MDPALFNDRFFQGIPPMARIERLLKSDWDEKETEILHFFGSPPSITVKAHRWTAFWVAVVAFGISA